MEQEKEQAFQCCVLHKRHATSTPKRGGDKGTRMKEEKKNKTQGIRWKILKEIKSSTVLLKSEKLSARGGQEGKPNIP